MEKLLNHGGELHDHGGEDDCHHAHEFDQNVQGGAGGVLAGIADRIADDRRAVDGVFGTVGKFFAAVVSFFDMFLGIIPCAARVVQEAGEGEPLPPHGLAEDLHHCGAAACGEQPCAMVHLARGGEDRCVRGEVRGGEDELPLHRRDGPEVLC